MMIFGILFIAAITALFALAFAFILAFARPTVRWKRRVAISALGAGFIPTMPAFFAIASARNGLETDMSGEAVIALSAIFVLALFLAAVIGFPVAYAYTRRSEARRNPPIDPDVFG